jgi:hypothetical protein
MLFLCFSLDRVYLANASIIAKTGSRIQQSADNVTAALSTKPSMGILGPANSTQNPFFSAKSSFSSAPATFSATFGSSFGSAFSPNFGLRNESQAVQVAPFAQGQTPIKPSAQPQSILFAQQPPVNGPEISSARSQSQGEPSIPTPAAADEAEGSDAPRRPFSLLSSEAKPTPQVQGKDSFGSSIHSVIETSAFCILGLH